MPNWNARPTKDQFELSIQRVLRAIAESERRRAEMEARLADLAAEQAKHINQSVGILLGGMALAVGLILGFG